MLKKPLPCNKDNVLGVLLRFRTPRTAEQICKTHFYLSHISLVTDTLCELRDNPGRDGAIVTCTNKYWYAIERRSPVQ